MLLVLTKEQQQNSAPHSHEKDCNPFLKLLLQIVSLALQVSSGDDSLAAWRSKVSLEKVLEGIVDGRSVQGLERAWQRLTSNPMRRAEGQVVGNYFKVVQVAQQLSPNNIQSTSDEDLRKIIAVLDEEKINWPLSTRYALTMRRASTLLVEKKIVELIDVINPWAGQEVWDANKPLLAALGDPQKALGTWKKMLFEDLLSDLISRGEEASEQVQALSNLCLQRLQLVDMLELDHNSAALLDDAMTVFRALLALLVPILVLSQEVVWEPSSYMLNSLGWLWNFIWQALIVFCQCNSSLKWSMTATPPKYVLRPCSSIPKADVQRLKASMTRTQKTVLCQVAVCIEASQWWQHELTYFIATAPAMLEKGPLVMRSLELLQQTEVTIVNAGVLLDMLRNLLVWERVLRLGVTDGLKESLLETLHKLGATIPESDNGSCGSKDLQTLMEVVTEACTCYPMDAALQGYLEKVARLIQSSAERDVVAALQAAVSAMVDQDGTDVAMFEQKLDNVLVNLEKSHVDHQKVDGRVKDAVKLAFMKLVGFMDSLWENALEHMKLLKACADCGVKLAVLMGDQPLINAMTYVQNGMFVQEACCKLDEVNHEVASLVLLQALVGLQRHVSKMVLPDIITEELKQQSFFTKLQVMKGKAKGLSTSKRNALVGHVTEALIGCKTALSDIAKGVSGGQDWLTDMTAETFEQLLEHASKTLLKTSGPTLTSSYSAVAEAAILYKLIVPPLQKT
eukprot:273220-Amphidinium_carterae.2